MTIDDLVAEGKRLAKPSMLLRDEPTPTGVLAQWGGRALTSQQRPDHRHRVSFDCEWLSRNGLRFGGLIGVYEFEPRWEGQVPIIADRLDEPLAEQRFEDATPLYGTPAPSFPPLEALCLYGGPVVDEWLAGESLERIDYDRACYTELGEAYNNAYFDRRPAFQKRPPAAILGGWHALWPDDEFYLPREMRLAIWTIWDAEPWIEVFERAPNLPVRVRAT